MNIAIHMQLSRAGTIIDTNVPACEKVGSCDKTNLSKSCAWSLQIQIPALAAAVYLHFPPVERLISPAVRLWR
jgi:hypothetical protein